MTEAHMDQLDSIRRSLSKGVETPTLHLSGTICLTPLGGELPTNRKCGITLVVINGISRVSSLVARDFPTHKKVGILHHQVLSVRFNVFPKGIKYSTRRRMARERRGAGLLLLAWRHQIRNNILKMCYRQSRRGVLRQNSRSATQ